MSEITQWLNDPSNPADSGLAAGLYAELQRLARARMAGERPGHTLEPTALVHEAWLRLEKSAPAAWRDRRQFYAAAAEVMRRILVESARRRLAHKRGGGNVPLPLDDIPVASPLPDERLLRVHEVLDRLALADETKARIVKLRFFAGMKNEEIAALLEVNEKTVRRHWELAKVWLFRALREDS